MKKLTYILLIGISLFTISCKKDSVNMKSLNGTSWTFRINASSYMTFKFTSNNDVEYTEKWDGERFDASGTYTYNKPDVRITLDFDDDEIGTVKYRCTISENKMIITSDIDDYESEVYFTKD